MANILGGSSDVTTTTAAVYIKQHYAAEAQLACRKAQVLAGTMDTSYSEVMSSGRALKIPHVLNLPVTAKSDNTVIIPTYATAGDQDITVDQYYYTSFYVPSIVQVQNDYDYIQLMGGQIGYALTGQIETAAAELPDSLSDYVGTLGLELTMDDWETAWQKLQLGLAPTNDRFAWLSSAAISAIRKLGTPISADFTRSNMAALDTATLGTFLGMKIVESQYLHLPAAGQHECAAFQRQQFLLIRQKEPTVERDRMLGDIADLILGWEIYAVAEREIGIETASTDTQGDNWGVWLKTV
jgi:hypothetical protein